MYVDGCEDIIKLTYDEAKNVKGTGLYIVKANNLLGLFDTHAGKLVVPTKFTGMTYQGPSLTFHDLGKLSSYALIYLKDSHKTIEFKDGLFSTRVAGSVKLFISNGRDIRILAVRRNNGTVALDTHYLDMRLPNRADSGQIACSIKTTAEKIHIILNNGYVHTIESYFKEKFKEVYILEEEGYLAISKDLVGEKLDSFGLNIGRINKVVDRSKLGLLRRII